jgi:hypothetical protein
MSAAAWWRLLRAHGFRIRVWRLPVAASVTLAAANNSLLGLLQSAIYGARLRDTNIEHDPIFVLGHWRSGTTHLHELPLILKSPPHTARMAVLARMFPNARFLHIVRDPYAVFASTLHLWRKTQAVSVLMETSGSALEAYVLQALNEMYRDFDDARAALQPGRFHQVRYEDLVREPLATLEECYQVIGLGDFDRVRPRVAGYLAGLRDYRTNEYAISSEGREAVRDAWGPIFRHWGYDI